MKRFSFLMAALLVAMTGCQKEPQQKTEAEGNNIYMTFSVKPVTKSATDGEGNSNSDANPEIEVGKDEENKISNVQVYLHSTEGNIKATDVNLVGGGVYYTATFKEEQIKKNATYSVYVICNDTETLATVAPDTQTKTISATAVSELNISADNNFLMTNAEQAVSIQITEEKLNSCMSPATPLNLGIVKVERTVARFDYANVEADNLYEIAGNTVQINLCEAAVINVSNASYYYRRVATIAEDGTVSAAEIGGVEGPTNYVVDTDWTAKTTLKGTWAKETAATLFTYPLEDEDSWEWIDITNLAEDDNIEGQINGSANEYHFLSYVSENTLPGVEAQINGLSTGVVFRGYLHDGTAKLSGTENLYVYANKYYGNWDAVAAVKDTDVALSAAYEAVKADPTDLAACATAGFTVYTPDASGNYPVYYYYWNRHNDNGDNFKMGPMEFAVVRNNVYKLAVTKINNFGHPENPEGDPDPIKPENEDEQVRHYFQVSVKVLPWTVRVNNIEF